MSNRFNALSLSMDGDIARIVFTRPELHNRFDEILHAEFPLALAALADNPGPAVLIIAAEGKSFSAGGDFDMMLRANGDVFLRRCLEDEARRIYRGFLSLPIPIIAAVQGPAIGLGASIVALSDIAVASRDAVIADPHVAVGLVAGDGGVAAWAAAIGVNRAKRFLLTGDRITAAQAFEMGLVTDLVDTSGEVMQVAQHLAERIVQLPRGGVQGTKRAFNQLSAHFTGNVFEYALQEEMRTMAGAEMASVVEKMHKR